jgi:hypothetical protein
MDDIHLETVEQGNRIQAEDKVSRDKISTTGHDERFAIAKEGTDTSIELFRINNKLITQTNSKLDKHIATQLLTDKNTSEKLGDNAKTLDILNKKMDELKPLTTLIPTIEGMVNDKQAYTVIGQKVIKWISIVAAIAGILWAIVAIWKSIGTK